MARRGGAVRWTLACAIGLFGGCDGCGELTLFGDIDGGSSDSAAPRFEPPFVGPDHLFGDIRGEPNRALGLAFDETHRWTAYFARAGLVYATAAPEIDALSTAAATVIASDVHGELHLGASGDYVAWRADRGGAGGRGPSGTSEAWLDAAAVPIDPRVSSHGHVLGLGSPEGDLLRVAGSDRFLRMRAGVHETTSHASDVSLFASVADDPLASKSRVVVATTADAEWRSLRAAADARASRVALAVREVLVVAWTELSVDSGVEHVQLAVVPQPFDPAGDLRPLDAVTPVTIASWPVAALEPLGSVTATATDDAVVVVAGGRSREESLVVRVDTSGSHTVIGPLAPPPRGPVRLPSGRSVSLPCRPIASASDGHRVAILCGDERRGGEHVAVLPDAEYVDLGRSRLGAQRAPRIACPTSPVDECAVVWSGATPQAVRFSRARRAPTAPPFEIAAAGSIAAVWDGRLLAVSSNAWVEVSPGATASEAGLPPSPADVPPAIVASPGGLIASVVVDGEGVRLLARPTGASRFEDAGLIASSGTCRDLVAAPATGGAIVAFTEIACAPMSCTASPQAKVRAFRVALSAERATATEIEIGSSIGTSPAIAGDRDRHFLVWDEPTSRLYDDPVVVGRLIHSDRIVRELDVVRGRRPRVTAWDERFFVAWVAPDGIRGRRFDRDGIPLPEPSFEAGIPILRDLEGDVEIALSPLDRAHLLLVTSTPAGVTWRYVYYPDQELQ